MLSFGRNKASVPMIPQSIHEKSPTDICKEILAANLNNCEAAVAEAGKHNFQSQCHIVLHSAAVVNAKTGHTKENFTNEVNVAEHILQSLPAGTRVLYEHGSARINKVELMSTQNSTKVPLLLNEPTGRLPPRCRVAGTFGASGDFSGLAYIPASSYASTGNPMCMFDDSIEHHEHSSAGGLTMDQQSMYQKLDLNTLRSSAEPLGNTGNITYTSKYDKDSDGDPFLALVCKNYGNFDAGTFTAIPAGNKFAVIMPSDTFEELLDCVEQQITCNLYASNIPLSNRAGDTSRQTMTFDFKPIVATSTAADKNAAYADLKSDGIVSAHLQVSFTVSSAREMEEEGQQA